MQLSNKILIVLFSFLFLYVIVAFTEMRFKGDLNQLDRSNSISETVDIDRINYLNILDIDQRIVVSGSNRPGIEVKSISGNMLQYLKYEMVGDTLSIKSLELLKKQAVYITIYVPKNTFKGLTSTNSMLTISELDQETLSIHQTDGLITISQGNKINKLNLNAQFSAYFKLTNTEIDTLNVTLSSSEVLTDGAIKLVKGSMTKDSYLHLVGTSEIQIKKDESSRLTSNRLLVNKIGNN